MVTWKLFSHSQLIQDLRCKPAVLKRRHGAPAFQTIFNKVFGLVRNQRQFRSHWIDLTSRTYFLRPKTFLLPVTKLTISNLSVSSVGSVFHLCNQMRQKWYKKILDTVDFANQEFPMCDFKLKHRENCGKLWKVFFWGGIGVRLMVSEKLMIGYLLRYAGYSVNIR